MAPTSLPVTATEVVESKKQDATESELVVDESEVSQKEIRATLRRMDIITLPVLTTLLAFCFIDRANMGLAAVAGMTADLRFVGYQYSISLLVFFPGYALFALPSNYILTKTSVRYWLTLLSVGFGVFTLAMGFARSFEGIVALRAVLGIFEAGVFPAIIVVLGSWYPRYNLGKRMAFVFCGASLISSLAGILAYAFSRIQVPNYPGWRWIFILEGAITIAIVLGAFFLIDEYPKESRFLTARQREVAVGLIAKDRAEHDEQKMTFRSVLLMLRDWRLWAFACMYMFCTVTTYSVAYFMPLILNRQMGFSGALSQVLTTPPYFWAFFLATGLTSWSDKLKLRSPFLMFFSLNVLLGVSLTRWGPNTGSQLLGLFFTLGGAQGNVATTLGFGQNNTPTRIKRSVGSGLQLTLGAIGGIIGSTVFRSQDAPTYTPGVITVLCCTVGIMLLGGILATDFYFQNRAHREHGRILENQEGFMYTM